MSRSIYSAINKAVKAAERERKRQVREAERERIKIGKENSRLEAARIKSLLLNEKKTYLLLQEQAAEDFNEELQTERDSMVNILETALKKCSYVDLELLRKEPVHPPFLDNGLGITTPRIKSFVAPSKPKLKIPPAPTGIFASLKKKKHERLVAETKEKFPGKMKRWEEDVLKEKSEKKKSEVVFEREESLRVKKMQLAKIGYEEECNSREKEIAAENKSLDEFITNLAYGVPEAVQGYIAMVLNNSTYPSNFPIEHECRFDHAESEMELAVQILPPAEISSIKGYKYKKSSDEITHTELSKKALRDIYQDAIEKTALRALHEIFQADRGGVIRAVSIKVGTKTENPATGHNEFIPLLGVAVSRDIFIEINLKKAVPKSTLKHIGATISKNPYDLIPVITSGVKKY
jgi:restriction system protein